MLKYMYSESLFDIYIEIKHECQKKFFPQNKLYKKCTFFLSRAPTHHSFAFNSRFLHGLKHNSIPSRFY